LRAPAEEAVKLLDLNGAAVVHVEAADNGHALLDRDVHAQLRVEHLPQLFGVDLPRPVRVVLLKEQHNLAQPRAQAAPNALADGADGMPQVTHGEGAGGSK